MMSKYSIKKVKAAITEIVIILTIPFLLFLFYRMEIYNENFDDFFAFIGSSQINIVIFSAAIVTIITLLFKKTLFYLDDDSQTSSPKKEIVILDYNEIERKIKLLEDEIILINKQSNSAISPKDKQKILSTLEKKIESQSMKQFTDELFFNFENKIKESSWDDLFNTT